MVCAFLCMNLFFDYVIIPLIRYFCFERGNVHKMFFFDLECWPGIIRQIIPSVNMLLSDVHPEPHVDPP